MKNTKRALRRHHRQRMIRSASRSYVLSFWDNRDPEWKRRQVMRWYNNLKICSCYGCGNPRKHCKEVTIQERRFKEAARYELREYGAG